MLPNNLHISCGRTLEATAAILCAIKFKSKFMQKIFFTSEQIILNNNLTECNREKKLTKMHSDDLFLRCSVFDLPPNCVSSIYTNIKIYRPNYNSMISATSAIAAAAAI